MNSLLMLFLQVWSSDNIIVLYKIILRNCSCTREGKVRSPRPGPPKVKTWHEIAYIVAYLHNASPDPICAYST